MKKAAPKKLGVRQVETLLLLVGNPVKFKPTRRGEPWPVMRSLMARGFMWAHRRLVDRWVVIGGNSLGGQQGCWETELKHPRYPGVYEWVAGLTQEGREYLETHHATLVKAARERNRHLPTSRILEP